MSRADPSTPIKNHSGLIAKLAKASNCSPDTIYRSAKAILKDVPEEVFLRI